MRKLFLVVMLAVTGCGFLAPLAPQTSHAQRYRQNYDAASELVKLAGRAPEGFVRWCKGWGLKVPHVSDTGVVCESGRNSVHAKIERGRVKRIAWMHYNISVDDAVGLIGFFMRFGKFHRGTEWVFDYEGRRVNYVPHTGAGQLDIYSR